MVGAAAAELATPIAEPMPAKSSAAESKSIGFALIMDIIFVQKIATTRPSPGPQHPRPLCALLKRESQPNPSTASSSPAVAPLFVGLSKSFNIRYQVSIRAGDSTLDHLVKRALSNIAIGTTIAVLFRITATYGIGIVAFVSFFVFQHGGRPFAHSTAWRPR
ncbi:hypothetical protein LAUMK35_04757 [Mycobacterium pseudokansasii]|nr:hypothetical protein LAUMK35_04757 [Mycobacterium pseudokansasii]VBA32275.1 hypothetical protein LAUMK21_04747 [Mycobacterium pseudokansasii]